MSGKKLIVLSDSHGSKTAVKTVLGWAKDRLPPDDTICAAAFLGDGLADLRAAADAAGFYCEWHLVCGNNDYGYSVPGTCVFDFCDHRFFMCHGHRHSIYAGWHGLTAAARSSGAEIVLFGHSHVPVFRKENGILLINPGSVARPRSRIGATFAVIECVPEEPPKVQFWGVGDGGSIKKVKL